MIRMLLALACFVRLATPAAAQLGRVAAVDTVVVEYRALMTPETTPADVRRRAIEGALAESVRRVAGVQVQTGTLAVKEERQGAVRDEFISVVQLEARGRVVDYAVLEEEWVTTRHPEIGSQIYLRVIVRAAVAHEVGQPDAAFHLSISLNAPSLIVRSQRPAENDEMIVTVASTSDAALTLVSIVDDSVVVLFPNSYVTSTSVRAGESTVLPATEWRNRGLRLRASLPLGRSTRREVVMAIAVKGETVPFLGETTLELQRWLIGIPLERRAIATAVIEVRRPE
ncbi:MAG: hypothetical protein ABI877_20600 [Gemmatimonadaceae bacterium]